MSRKSLGLDPRVDAGSRLREALARRAVWLDASAGEARSEKGHAQSKRHARPTMTIVIGEAGPAPPPVHPWLQRCDENAWRSRRFRSVRRCAATFRPVSG
jgi:hypothetical protein